MIATLSQTKSGSDASDRGQTRRGGKTVELAADIERPPLRALALVIEVLRETKADAELPNEPES